MSQEEVAPLLTEPIEKWIIVTMDVQEVLKPVANRVKFVRLPDPSLGQYSPAHIVLCEYQHFTNKEIAEFQRHLVSLARRALTL